LTLGRRVLGRTQKRSLLRRLKKIKQIDESSAVDMLSTGLQAGERTFSLVQVSWQKTESVLVVKPGLDVLLTYCVVSACGTRNTVVWKEE
jgi:hypothetical protein